MSSGQRVGIIGCGNIGGAIAANLVQDGHHVVVHDASPERLRPLIGLGARAADSPARVAERSEITFTSLPMPAVVDDVARQWLEGAAAGSVLVDLSTNAPASVRALGARLGAAGCHLLEAPLTGGTPGAQARLLVFMVGGDDAVSIRHVGIGDAAVVEDEHVVDALGVVGDGIAGDDGIIDLARQHHGYPQGAVGIADVADEEERPGDRA